MGTRVSLRSLAGRRGPGPEPSLQSRDTRWGEGGSRVSRRDGVWRGSELGLTGRDRREERAAGLAWDTGASSAEGDLSQPQPWSTLRGPESAGVLAAR